MYQSLLKYNGDENVIVCTNGIAGLREEGRAQHGPQDSKEIITGRQRVSDKEPQSEW